MVALVREQVADWPADAPVLCGARRVKGVNFNKGPIVIKRNSFCVEKIAMKNLKWALQAEIKFRIFLIIVIRDADDRNQLIREETDGSTITSAKRLGWRHHQTRF
ncbi:MAG: hypothetical protein ACYTBS_14075 [Planctomycetota bacterium]